LRIGEGVPIWLYIAEELHNCYASAGDFEVIKLINCYWVQGEGEEYIWKTEKTA
jgi:hypothetical protein